MATLEFSESPDWREALSAAKAARERLTSLCARQPTPDRAEVEDAFASWFQTMERVADEIQQAPHGWEHLPRELQWDLPAVEPWRTFVRDRDVPDDWCAVWRALATREVLSSTATKVREWILWLYGNAGLNAADRLHQPEAADALYRAGIARTDAFLAQGETATEVREFALWLYSTAGLNVADRLHQPETADALYRAGIAHAEAFLAQGETAAGVHEWILRLYIDAGINAADRLHQPEAADALYRAGIAHGDAFLAQGETATDVRKFTLRLHFNAGLNAADRLHQPEAADALYRTGISHAETFLAEGETAAEVRELTLWLYTLAGANASEELQQHVIADELFRRGITHADAFLAQGETHTKIRKVVLELYFNAATNVEQGLHQPAAADTLYRAGIAHADAFLAQGETATEVRELTLSLHFNAGLNAARRLHQPEAADALYRTGISHAETFLAEGETAAEVRELTLWLYTLAGANASEELQQHVIADELFRRGIAHADIFLAQGKSNFHYLNALLYFGAGKNMAVALHQPAAADTLYRAGIAHADAFLAQGETHTEIRKAVLDLYFNAATNVEQGLHQPAAADTLYRAGIAHADAFLAQGETATEVRELTLRLYCNAGANAADRLHQPEAADELYRAGIAHADAFLAQGETHSEIRRWMLYLYFSNAGVNAADALTADALCRAGITHAEAFLTQGETAAGVRELTLLLYDAHADAAAALHQPEAADARYRAGIVHADAFLVQGEVDIGVRAQTLLLYSNAGVNAADRLHQPEAADALYRAGIAHADAFLAQGETATKVRELTLSLHFNTATNIENGLHQPEAADPLYRAGIARADAFLAQGETATEVRKLTLRLYVNAGANAADRLHQPETADALYRAGIAHAEAFLTQGEADTGVRAQTLLLYSNAGANAAAALHQPEAADALFGAGISHAIALLAQGETATKVRKLILRLYFNAGANAAAALHQPATADTFYHAGIAHADAFLAQGEMATEVRELTLRLYCNAGVNAADRLHQPAAEDALYRAGIAHADAFLAQGEVDTGVRTQTLLLYSNAGINAADRLHQPEAADALYHSGIAHADAFLAQGETAAGVRELTLRLYCNAGVNAADRLHQPAAADALDRAGIAHADVFLAQGETATKVRELTLRLYSNAGVNAARLNTIHQGRHDGLVFRVLRWAWAETLPLMDSGMANADPPAVLLNLPPSAVPALWTAFLRTWLLHLHGPTVEHVPSVALETLLQVAEAALLLDSAERNQPFRNLLDELLEFQTEIEAVLAADAETRRSLRETLQAALRRLGRDHSALDAPEDVTALGDVLAARPLFERLRPSYWRARRALPRYQTHLAQPPRFSDRQWRALKNGQDALIDWLAERLRATGDFHTSLDALAPVALAVLLAGQVEDPETTVARWRAQPPWDDPATLDVALERTGWRAWLPDAGDTNHRALYGWTDRQPHARRLRIAEDLLNQTAPDLQAALRARADGQADPLRTWLAGAWQEALANAPPLGRLLDALARPEATDAPLDPTTVMADATPPSPESLARALAAVALGDGAAAIRAAVAGWLDRILPLSREADLPTGLRRAKARFSLVLSAAPNGALDAPALSARLHAWSRTALGRELASPRPDPDRLWTHLERGRIALTALAMPAPDAAWREATTTALRDVIQASLTAAPVAGTPWPPLACWLDRVRSVLPAASTAAACQRRLPFGEALAQPFFDPHTGQLRALWLTRDRPLACRDFPESAHADRWHGSAGVLEPWARWIENGELAEEFAELFATLAASAPVRAVGETLRRWASEAGCRHLTLVLPAELAQLPWEAFEIFDAEALTWERAVTLTNWRTAPDPPLPTEPLALIAHGRATGYGPEEAAAASAYWRSPAPDPALPPTAFDLLAGLRRRSHGHLILHGHYAPLNPRASYLEVDAAERLYAWSLAALAPPGHLGLSACRAALHGRAATPWLGPVGLGPALIAAGARRVIGPLWRCHQVATWLFQQLLYETAAAHPEQPWSWRLARARMQLRGLSLAETTVRLQAGLGARYRELDFWDLEDPPFANPYYWAPFILLGDDGPWPQPGAADPVGAKPR